jgi:tetratricopeptide (TPR) repeat protein
MRLLLTYILVSIVYISYGQRDFSKELMNNWKKTEIRTKDGSKLYDQTYVDATFDINIFSKDSLALFSYGKRYSYPYVLKDSILSFNKIMFKIKSISETQLVLDQADFADETKALSLKFTPKKLFDLTYTPKSYISKNGERVYQQVDGKLEPHFLDKNMAVMDYIFEKFGFPEYRKGGFVVRFVITKTGALKGVAVVASTNDKYNDKLVAAVNKTKGKWIPAEYLGEKVNVEVEYDYNLNYIDRSSGSVVDSLEYSKMYFNYGNEFFERASYKQAETYYQKAISHNPLHIDAYYQHAACLILLRRREEACKDYQQLVFLEQKKAKVLQDKYCK